MTTRIRIRSVAIALLGVLGVGGTIAWRGGWWSGRPGTIPANALVVIEPYRYAGTWVFDDRQAGLLREPFVAGMPEMVDHLVREIPGATNGFRMLLSAQPFPGYQKKLVWVRGDMGGNHYRMEEPVMMGWLCPAMFRYYEKAPAEFYVKAEPKG